MGFSAWERISEWYHYHGGSSLVLTSFVSQAAESIQTWKGKISDVLCTHMWFNN